MNIEQIAEQVARDFQLVFDGIELDFALEVTKRAVEAEREACAKVCQAVISSGEFDGYQQYAAAACRNEIALRSNT